MTSDTFSHGPAYVHFNYIQMVTYFFFLLNNVCSSVLNYDIYKIKTVAVAISHIMSPLAGMKQNQNKKLEAYTQTCRGMLKMVDMTLFHLNYIKKTTKSFNEKRNKK